MTRFPELPKNAPEVVIVVPSMVTTSEVAIRLVDGRVDQSNVPAMPPDAMLAKATSAAHSPTVHLPMNSAMG